MAHGINYSCFHMPQLMGLSSVITLLVRCKFGFWSTLDRQHLGFSAGLVIGAC